MNGIKVSFDAKLMADPIRRTNSAGYTSITLKVLAQAQEPDPQWMNVLLTKNVPPEAVLGLRQGSRVHIEGFISLSRWKAPDGSQRQGLGVRAISIRSVGKVARKRPSDLAAARPTEAAIESMPARTASPDDPIPF